MDAKKNLLDNIIVQMAGYVDKSTLQVLEHTIVNELIDFDVNPIETLPSTYDHDVDIKNQYILEMFEWKRRINDNTKEQYMLAIKELLSLIHKPLPDISNMDIYYYLHWYDNKPGKQISAVTYNNRRRCLSAFYEWMRKERLAAYNPVDNVEPKKEIQKPIDYFTQKEFIQLRDACKNIRERALIEFLRSTGVRAGELIEIAKNQINWETGDILILSEKSNSRYRTIWLDDEAMYYLEKYLSSRKDDSPYIFPQSRAPYQKISRNGIYSIIKKLGKRAGLTCRCYPHKLRKTLGMTLIGKGVNISYIKDIMGHASTSVTERYYARTTPEMLRRVRQTVA